MTPANPLVSRIDALPGWSRALLVAALLLIVSLAAYLPALNAGFVWDDDYYVTANPTLTTARGMSQIWFDIFRSRADYVLPQYYPLVHTTFWLEYRLWGLDPAGYHAVNILLHLTSALLIWFILARLRVPGALLAAVIFAVHPVHVESVAWIAERKNTLSLTLALASLYVFLRYFKLVDPPDPTQKKLSLPDEPARLYAIGALLFLLALLSKTVTATVPAVLLVMIWWRLGRLDWKRHVLPMAPLLVVGFLMGQLTSYLEVHRVGAQGPAFVYGETALGQFAGRLMVATQAVWFYVYKLLIPYPTMFNYPRFDPTLAGRLSVVPWALLVTALAVLATLWRLREKIGRGPVAVAMIYLGCIFPALGFVNVFPHIYSFVADHFVYHASVALIAGLAAALTMLWERRQLPVGVGLGAAVAVVIVLVVLSNRQARAYESIETLWRDTLAKNPDSWQAKNNLAKFLIDSAFQQQDPARRQQKFDEAIDLLLRVVESRPDHAESRYNLGLIGEWTVGSVAGQPAVAWYLQALEIDPDHAQTRLRLGILYRVESERHQALAMAKSDPASDEYRPIEASLHRQLADTGLNESQRHLRHAIQVRPRFIDPYIQLAGLLVQYDQPEQAIPLLERVLEIDDDNEQALRRIVQAYVLAGRVQDAILVVDQLTRLRPHIVNSLLFKLDYGVALARVGGRLPAGETRSALLQAAVDQFEQAVRLDPRSVEARANLALALLQQGQVEQARRQATTVLEKDPANPIARRVLSERPSQGSPLPTPHQLPTMPSP